MAQTQTTSQRLYDLLVTRGFDPVTKDPSTGRDIAPADAKIIKFDYKSSSGKDYGTAVIILGDDQQLQLFFGDSMGKSMENPDKDEWFEFLHQLAQFSVRNGFNTFSPLNINQLKHYQAGMAAIREGLFEGYYGTRQVSYMGEATQARLMIRHKRPLGENDARHRQIQALFIETQDGERFRLPFESLVGGRAMLEHVRQGGRPYDIRGSHIANMVQEAKILSRFRRASQGRVLEGVTQEIASRADVYYQNLRENLHSLATSRGYSTYFETWAPDESAQSDALVEDLKNLFVEQTLDQRIEQALPVLARIQGSAMKEAEIFENWINQVAEGADDLASNREAQRRLQELLSQPELPVGAEGMNVIPELEDIIGYDAEDEKDNEDFEQLKDRLITLSVENSADADAREVIRAWLEEKGIDVGDAEVAAQQQPEPAPELAPAAEPAAATPAAPVPAAPAAPPQPPVTEGAGELTPDYYEKLAKKHEADGQRGTPANQAYANKMVDRARKAADILKKGGSQEQALRHYQGTDKEQGVAEGFGDARYKIKVIGKDKNGDYYVSPNTGKRVYKKANRGDHESPSGILMAKIKEQGVAEGSREMEYIGQHHGPDAKKLAMKTRDEMAKLHGKPFVVVGPDKIDSSGKNIHTVMTAADAKRFGHEPLDVAEGYTVDDEDNNEQGSFFVAIYNIDDDSTFVGEISKRGGRWRCGRGQGKEPYGWGGHTFMSYLTVQDVMTWIHKDYSRGYEVEGPFDSLDEAVQFAEHNFGPLAEGDNLATFVGPNEDSTDAMDHRGAVTDSFYEDLARIKTLALSK